MSRVQLAGIEVRHLQAFAGRRRGGLVPRRRRTARYAQGSVSAQIGALEQMIGTSLLERAPGRPVRLTPAGDAFYVHALNALAQLRAGAEEAVSAETSRTAAVCAWAPIRASPRACSRRCSSASPRCAPRPT
jgi:DNA-binding transcriptional LysR family regulator